METWIDEGDLVINGEGLEERIAKALRESGLVGCDCCASDELGYYDQDDCPVDEDGWKDHLYYDGCLRDEDRILTLAKIAVSALVRGD